MFQFLSSACFGEIGLVVAKGWIEVCWRGKGHLNGTYISTTVLDCCVQSGSSVVVPIASGVSKTPLGLRRSDFFFLHTMESSLLFYDWL